ncbi:MAG: EAL domain-containing protein [Myxococcota bacterium]|jgi:diguanylate cyclase (GGDEF)-like protein/PAS domain S-box-containing protein|nr:EAL domain-containing protein [Myxococcota bacterium]
MKSNIDPADYVDHLLDGCPQAVLMLSRDGLIQYASQATANVLGYAPSELRGRPFIGLLRPEDAFSLSQALEEMRTRSRHLVVSLQSTSGAWLSLELTLVNVDDERVLAFCADVSRRRELERSTRLFAAALEHVEESIIITDAEGFIEYVNRAFERRTGYSRDEVLGLTPRVLRSDHHDAQYFRDMWANLRSGQSFEAEMVSRCKDGSSIAENKLIVPVRDSDAQISHHVAIGKVSKNHCFTRSSSDPLATTMHALREGLWEYDIQARRVHFSPHWKRSLGYDERELGSSPDDWERIIAPEDREGFQERWLAHLNGETAQFEYEHRLITASGERRWVFTRGLIIHDGDAPVRVVGYQTDITERKQHEEALVRQAQLDPLTGLPNRLVFSERLKLAIQHSQRDPDFGFAVLFLDLDRFKVINDSLGHLAGDELLRAFAVRIATCLRTTDTLARLGGDEFGILLEGVASSREAMQLSQRIHRALDEPFDLDGRNVYTSTSIGIAIGNGQVDKVGDLLRDADIAMYHAKNQGKARSAMFDSSMHHKALRLMELETDLRAAIERSELLIYYQPIVSIENGEIEGFEALLRWPHPTRGLISPAEFVPIAEETGFINSLGIWVMREACRQLRVWQCKYARNRTLYMCVNLSSAQFLRFDLSTKIDQILRETGVAEQSLKLELTESMIMQHSEYADQMLAQLKAQKIRLSIDDFGTGYSSMSYLRRYPIDTVKVDQSFVRRMCRDSESLVIVKTVIDMAHNLAMDVVAEGVESREQLDLLREIGCENAQGFYFSKAIPAQEAEAMLLSDRRW